MSGYIILQKLRELILFLQLCCVFLVGNILIRVSYARKITVKMMHKAAGVALPENLYWDSLFTQAMMKTLWEQGTLDIRKAACFGEKAPDPMLVDLSTGEERRLSKAVDARKMQVIAFGSYTCPVFRIKFKELQSMAEEFSHSAEFSMIYIDEAHPIDGWAFKDEVQISKHQSIEDRLNAANKFSSAFCKHSCIRVFADSMKNEATVMYGVSAIRLYVLYNDTVIYEGGIGPTYYSLDEVRQAIQNRHVTCVVV